MRRTRSVILIGPPPTITGGMSSVVEQINRLDLAPHYRQRFMPVTFSPGPGESPLSRIIRHARQARRLAALIRDTGASIVHIHTCSGMSLWRSLVDQHIAQRAGCKTVLHIHGARFDEFHDRAGALRRRCIRGGLTRADAVVALSSAWHRTLTGIAPRANVRIVENAVAPPDNPPTSNPQSAIRNSQGPRRFLLLARMDTWKGIDDLLEACRILRKRGVRFELTLAGPEGSAGDAAAITAKISRVHLVTPSSVRPPRRTSCKVHQDAPYDCVRYIGEVRGAQKDRWLRWADVYVQPSHNEGMPIAVLEALAYGLPVIATRVGAMPEIVASPHVGDERPVRQEIPPPTRGDATVGLLTPPRDPQALADAMERLATDDEARRHMAVAARTLARTRFSLGRLRDDLMALYGSLPGRCNVSRGVVPSNKVRDARHKPLQPPLFQRH